MQGNIDFGALAAIGVLHDRSDRPCSTQLKGFRSAHPFDDLEGSWSIGHYAPRAETQPRSKRRDWG